MCLLFGLRRNVVLNQLPQMLSLEMFFFYVGIYGCCHCSALLPVSYQKGIYMYWSAVCFSQVPLVCCMFFSGSFGLLYVFPRFLWSAVCFSQVPLVCCMFFPGSFGLLYVFPRFLWYAVCFSQVPLVCCMFFPGSCDH